MVFLRFAMRTANASQIILKQHCCNTTRAKFRYLYTSQCLAGKIAVATFNYDKRVLIKYFKFRKIVYGQT